MSEGQDIGWEWTIYDIAKEERQESGNLNDFELMLNYHDISEIEFRSLSNNDQSRFWSNFKMFGTETTQEYKEKINSMLIQHSKNKAAPIGTTIKCACGCGKKLVKKSYQTQFFRNKGKGNCKDRYYNNIDENRRMRSKLMN